MFFMSTHNMLINYPIEQLEQDIATNRFVGLQLDLGFPLVFQ